MLLEMHQLPVKLIRKRVKNINLRILRTGEIHISAPLKMPIHVIHDFLQIKQPWIEKHHQRLSSSPQPKAYNLEHGSCIYFLGNPMKLTIQACLLQPEVILQNDQVLLRINNSATFADKHHLLTEWYREQMHGHMMPLIKKWEDIIGVIATKIHIKTMKTRWGSCHPRKKHISLNLRLIEQPLKCLEYVIVHELVHMLEASHNQRFHNLMTQYLPHWKQIKEQMKSY